MPGRRDRPSYQRHKWFGSERVEKEANGNKKKAPGLH